MITRPITRPVTSPIARAVNNPFGMQILNTIVRALFRNGEQGFAYNHNILATMWQDNAQSAPVTGPDQPVGFQFDLSGRGNHRFQTATASRPMLRYNATTGSYYLQYDGTDDFLVTNAINFTATDKVSLFAGVRNLSNTTALFAELSPDINTNNGAVSIVTGGASERYRVFSKGTIVQGAALSGAQYNAPHSSVISAIANISADSIVLRISGFQAAVSALDQGTGNYGNYPMYFGRRGGTLLPFNGHEYSPVCVGRLTTAAEIASIERMLARQVGVVLP